MNRASLCTALTLFVLIGALGLGNPFLTTVEGQMPTPVQPSGPSVSSDTDHPAPGPVGQRAPVTRADPISTEATAPAPAGIDGQGPGVRLHAVGGSPDPLERAPKVAGSQIPEPITVR